jgi:hypothetical protein
MDGSAGFLGKLRSLKQRHLMSLLAEAQSGSKSPNAYK